MIKNTYIRHWAKLFDLKKTEVSQGELKTLGELLWKEKAHILRNQEEEKRGLTMLVIYKRDWNIRKFFQSYEKGFIITKQ